MHQIDSCRKTKKGQSLVEFALILPVLVLIFLGILQFGLILSSQVTLNSAVREGVRIAALDKDEEEDVIIDKVTDVVFSTFFAERFISDTLVVQVIYDPSRTRGAEVKVTSDADVDIFIPFVNLITGKFYTISASASMRLEN